MKRMRVITLLSILLVFSISSCNWNRTEKAQRQVYKKGLTAPKALKGTLQRNQDYFQTSDEDLLNKMR